MSAKSLSHTESGSQGRPVAQGTDDLLDAVELLLARRYFLEVLAHLEGEAQRTDRAMGYLLTPADAGKLRVLIEASRGEGKP